MSTSCTMRKGTFAVLVLLACAQHASGCNLLSGILSGGQCEADEAVDRTMHELPEAAGKIFKQGVDVLAKKLGPFMEKVQAGISSAMSQVQQYVQSTIDHINQCVVGIINQIAEKAKELAHQVVHDVEQAAEKIVASVSKELDHLEEVFWSDVKQLMTQIDIMFRKAQCMETTGLKSVRDEIAKAFDSITLIPEYIKSPCWRQLNYGLTKKPIDLNDMQLYQWQKCEILSAANKTTDYHARAGIYAQGQLIACDYFCIGETAFAPAFKDWFTKERVFWGVNYNRWKNGKPTDSPTRNPAVPGTLAPTTAPTELPTQTPTHSPTEFPSPAPMHTYTTCSNQCSQSTSCSGCASSCSIIGTKTSTNVVSGNHISGSQQSTQLCVCGKCASPSDESPPDTEFHFTFPPADFGQAADLTDDLQADLTKDDME